MNRLKEIEARMKEIRALLEGSEPIDLDALEKEVRDLGAEKEQIEKRKEIVDGINNGNVETRAIHPGTSSFETAITSTGDEVRIYRRNHRLSDFHPNKEELSLGRYLRGAITGDWKNADKEQMEFRALSTATSSVMIPEVLSAQVIDLARNKSILFQSNVPMVEMTSNNLTISKVKTDPTFGFKAEGAATTESVMEFEGVTLKSKTAYGLISVTLEALKSSGNLESVVTNAIAESMARTIDLKCLYGQTANNEPKGILTYSEIGEQAETAALANYSPFVKAIGKVRKANGEPTAWALNATTDEMLNLLLNTQGDPMTIPPVVSNLQRLISNQLPSDGGTGTNESTSLIYDPSALLIGLQSPLMVEISREAGDAWQKGIVYLRVYAMLDIAVLRPERICKITGLKQA
ncbi:phage major capsid protein [Paenibacillus flagellatus]|uniref:Phage major capsid protein n=1 Tax=Paenibacillus flagellatus TaxID=2211139 RepID=A0A2V5KIW9_9BACL|nr:phage major capsid protein [Paenibacillus flagellatus]PYI54500.1 phage major capsid protein [Paenibacillus flagellatus]